MSTQDNSQPAPRPVGSSTAPAVAAPPAAVPTQYNAPAPSAAAPAAHAPPAYAQTAAAYPYGYYPYYHGYYYPSPVPAQHYPHAASPYAAPAPSPYYPQPQPASPYQHYHHQQQPAVAAPTRAAQPVPAPQPVQPPPQAARQPVRAPPQGGVSSQAAHTETQQRPAVPAVPPAEVVAASAAVSTLVSHDTPGASEMSTMAQPTPSVLQQPLEPEKLTPAKAAASLATKDTPVASETTMITEPTTQESILGTVKEEELVGESTGIDHTSSSLEGVSAETGASQKEMGILDSDRGASPSSISQSPPAESAATTDVAFEPTGMLERPLRPRRFLPEDYEPTKDDVVWSKFQKYENWPGTNKYYEMVKARMGDYIQTTEKYEKIEIFLDIIETIRSKGGILGQDGKGRWYDVGDSAARAKLSLSFQDLSKEEDSGEKPSKRPRLADDPLSVAGSTTHDTQDQPQNVPGSFGSLPQSRSSPRSDSHDVSISQQQLVPPPSEHKREPEVVGRPSDQDMGLALDEPTVEHDGAEAIVESQAKPSSAAENAEPDRSSLDIANAASAGSGQAAEHVGNQCATATNASVPSPQSSAVNPTQASQNVATAAASLQAVPSTHDAAPGPSAETPVAAAPDVSPPRKNVPAPAPSVASQAPHTHVPDMSTLTVCAMQPDLRKKDESPLDAATRILDAIERVSERTKVDLYVLPELAPVGYSEDTFQRFLPKTQVLKDTFGLIDGAFGIRAKRLGVYICYGTIGWKTNYDGRESYTIRQKVVDRNGIVVTTYDKIYLCDYGSCSETRYFEPGQWYPASFQIDGFRLGLLICADMRYPSLSRALARDHRVDALIQPAAFSRDTSFRTWQAFAETRAVENTVYFLGANYAGTDFGETKFVGPWVDEEHESVCLGTENGYLVGQISRSVLKYYRSAMPFHQRLCAESYGYK